MFSDPQFWVAVSFILFIAAIFNPVRKILTSSLDAQIKDIKNKIDEVCLLYTSPSPRDRQKSRMPSSA